jgi:glycerophosphoryl diester phosphodiesterase
MPALSPAGRLVLAVRLARSLQLLALCCGWCCLPPAAAIDLQGHRGARGLAPENTLTAFRAALAAGVTTLETDLALTRDGVLVLSHDPRLSPALTRGPDGVWLAVDGPAIHELDATTLARYDVGRLNPQHPYAAQWPAQKPADGERIPALVDLFDLARAARSPGGRPVRLNLETKITPRADVPAPGVAVFARAVVDAVRAAGFTDRVTVQSFDWRTLVEVRRLEPTLATACLTIESKSIDTVRPEADGASAWHAGLKAVDYGHSIVRLARAAGCSTWSPYWRNLTAELVAEAHAAGLWVVAWTVNEPADIEWLAALGVDGLITDYPDRARLALQARGLKVD